MKNDIDSLEKVLHSAIDIIALSLAKFGDGVQITDIVVVPSLAGDAFDIVKNLSEARSEVKDLDAEEVRQLLDGVINKLTELLSS